jgi:hypothetical protein
MDVGRVSGLLDRRPFVPFEVDLENGRRIPVTHPGYMVVFPDRARVREILVYCPERDGYSILWPDGITALHVERWRDASAGQAAQRRAPAAR